MKIWLQSQRIWRRLQSRSMLKFTYVTLLFAIGSAMMSLASDQLGNPESGQKLFRKCKSCHMVGESAKNRSGPVLNGIFGRVAGTVDGFRYSKSMMQAGEDGLVWHAGEMDEFLIKPKTYLPGTKMNFSGFKKHEDRADVLAYLRQFSDDPQNIPEADPTANATDHDVDPAILAIVGDPEYGEYLASECLTCHRADGGDAGIPSITGWPRATFVIAMHGYKSKTREHPVMQMMAGRLNNDEIAALAAYFETIE